MTKTRANGVLGGAVIAVLLASVPASAQQPTQPADPSRPFTGLFRGAPTAPHENLALELSLYGAFDQDRATQGDFGASDEVVTGGFYTGTDADLTYSPRQRGRVSFDTRVTSSVRYYERLQDIVAASQTGTAGATIRLARGTSLQGRGGIAYTPYFDYVTLPGMEETPGFEVPERVPDNTVSTRRVMTYDGAVDLVHGFNERTSLLVRYGARVSELLDQDQRALDTSASAGVSHRINRRLLARVSYVHRDSQYQLGPLDQSVQVDDVEFAFDKDWARSPTRRTTLTVTVGPSLVEQQGERFTRAFGGVLITHPFGRSWSFRGTYRRGVTFIQTVSKPYLSDSGSVSLSGLMTRRLDLSVAAGAVLGEVGFDGGQFGTAYDTYSASARARYGLTRTLALTGEYLYNFSQYSSGLGTPGMDGSSVRVGLTIFVPLLEDRAPRGGQ